MTDRPENVEVQDADEGLFPRLTPVQKVVAVAVLLVLGVVFVRFAIPPVTAAQARPDGHPPGPCVLCHLVRNGMEDTDGR